MARPRPVPPNRRVVLLSACSKAPKIASCRSFGIPIPVSQTANDSVTYSSSRRTNLALQHDFSFGRELDGVPHQVHNDLPQPLMITDEAFRDFRSEVTGQFQTLPVGAKRQ